ncbi:MAG TPA: glycosyl hydrolase family 18 protein [Spirochaetia bacterium]|jgi:chitinase|nr:glycosyl hydrolase family 18 protein [Spirochaetia bacterium]
MVSAGYFYAATPAEGARVLSLPLEPLTHLIVSFADISPEGLPVWEPSVEVAAVKKLFPNLKILLAVGGWTWSGRFSDAALTPVSRRRFADVALALLETHGFDGLDVDWEYPVVGGLPENIRRPEDRENYTALLAELRQTFDGAQKRAGRRLLLTSAQAAWKDPIEALETEKYHRYLDWIHLMTYDFHGSWHPEPGHNSDLATTEAAVQLHLNRGFPAPKIVVGTPLYAHQWVRQGPGPWVAGPVLLWHEAEALATPEASGWDEARGASWIETPERYVTWDSAQALEAKKTLVQRLGLGGMMTWQVTGDPVGRQLARMAISG